MIVVEEDFNGDGAIIDTNYSNSTFINIIDFTKGFNKEDIKDIGSSTFNNKGYSFLKDISSEDFDRIITIIFN